MYSGCSQCKGGLIMATLRYKHLRYEDRLVIQEFLNYGYSFTAISNRIHKDRRTISKEVLKHRFIKLNTAKLKKDCTLVSKAPYVCNGCSKRNDCRLIQYRYDATIAHNEYIKTLKDERSVLKVTKEQIAAINDVIAPLMINNHHSVNHVYQAHRELLPFSKPTFYRYIDTGILSIKNIDLRRKVKYRIKKEYNYVSERINPKVKINRFYTDFKDYLELHPNASIVEMDTVIGTGGGKGGKCFLTLLFRQYNFMLIYLLPYKRREYVIEVFNSLKAALKAEEFKRLFEVILTDNGTEFSDPESIEIDLNTGEKLSSLFYCDPNCSWQKRMHRKEPRIHSLHST